MLTIRWMVVALALLSCTRAFVVNHGSRPSADQDRKLAAHSSLISVEHAGRSLTFEVASKTKHATSKDKSLQKDVQPASDVNPHRTQDSVRSDGLYFMSFLAMVAIISLMYRSMGFAVICQIVTYVTCVVFVKLVMKLVYSYDYRYPVFVTSLHLLASSMCGFAVLLYRKHTQDKPIIVPTLYEMCCFICPITLSFAISIGSENSALVMVSAAFAEVVGACNPVMAACVTVACGMQFHFQLLAPIAVVITGCVMSVEGEKSFSALGFFLILLSALCRSLKAVLQEKLMTGETKDRFDPVTLMAYACGVSSLQMYTYSALREGITPPIHALLVSPDMCRLALAISCSAIIACALNMSALFVNKHLGAVGMQLVAQMKSVLVVSGGIILLHESFTQMQKFGFVVTLSGIYWYSSMKQRLSPGAKGH